MTFFWNKGKKDGRTREKSAEELQALADSRDRAKQKRDIESDMAEQRHELEMLKLKQKRYELEAKLEQYEPEDDVLESRGSEFEDIIMAAIQGMSQNTQNNNSSRIPEGTPSVSQTEIPKGLDFVGTINQINKIPKVALKPIISTALTTQGLDKKDVKNALNKLLEAI